MEHPEIPVGYYCYTIDRIDYGPSTPETAALSEIFKVPDCGLPRIKTIPCPYWSLDPADPHNGRCSFLNITDKNDGGLLWDQVKECDINIED
mgnify:CR=1 FL=1